MDDRRVISGIVYVLRNGLKWLDVPRKYGPSKVLCNHTPKIRSVRSTTASKSQGKPRVDDRRVISRIVYGICSPQWFEMAGRPEGIWALQGALQPLHSVNSVEQEGVFGKILQKLSKCKTKILMMDATHLKVHRIAASLKKGVFVVAHRAESREGLVASYMPFVMALGGWFWEKLRPLEIGPCFDRWER